MSDTSSVWLLLYYLFIVFEVCIEADPFIATCGNTTVFTKMERNDLTNWLILGTGSVKLAYGK